MEKIKYFVNWCKHIRSVVIGLAHALCRDTWQARRGVVIVLVLRNSGCTTVYNKSKLTVTEAHTITLQLETKYLSEGFSFCIEVERIENCSKFKIVLGKVTHLVPKTEIIDEEVSCTRVPHS